MRKNENPFKRSLIKGEGAISQKFIHTETNFHSIVGAGLQKGSEVEIIRYHLQQLNKHLTAK